MSNGNEARQIIRQLRGAGWTLKRIASLAGVSRQTIQNIQRGRNASDKTLGRLIEIRDGFTVELREELPGLFARLWNLIFGGR